MTDREAMFALAAPEPYYPLAHEIWQKWNNDKNEALLYARAQWKLEQSKQSD